MFVHWKKFLALTVILLLVGIWLGPGLGRAETVEEQIEAAVASKRFDFSTWVAGAAAAKITADLAANQAYLPEEARTRLVRAYIERLDELFLLEQRLEALYADSGIDNPAAAAAPLREQLVEHRAQLAETQSLVEAILQEQVAGILLEKGFGLGGRIWPPVRMRLTPLPTLLVTSPRDEIRQFATVTLEAGLPVAERVAIEAELAADHDLSFYVTDIGGLSLYPAMVLETTNLVFLVDVIAHEWAHTWFNQFPLGWYYHSTPAMRTINETAAGIIGREIGAAVISRYYPDLLPPPPVVEQGEIPPAETSVPAPFDFRVEMRITRLRVDELLAAGKVAEAEAYMERRRQLFLSNGYHLRVLNQAFFAFHGAYADELGAAGADPVGPLVSRVREASPNLRAFMRELAFVASFEALEGVATDLGVQIEEEG